MARKMKDSGIEWIGEIPEDWEIIKGRFIFCLRNSKGNDISLQLLSPTQKYGVIPQSLYEKLSGMKAVKLDENKDLSLFKTIHKGDYCISLRSFQGGFEYSEYEGVVSPAYQTFFAKKQICDIYYKYLFKNESFIHKISSYSLSLRDGKNILYSDFADMFLPVPPIQFQQAIADYLDKKCAQIDTALAKTRTAIEEYKKLKQAIITKAVTKGVRGNRPMKDSGIEWIGEIPAEWEVIRIKNIFSLRNERNNKPLQEVNLISLYTDRGVVQHCDLLETTGNKASTADGYKLVYKNDIVVNIILCWMGAIGRSEYFGVTSPAYDVYEPREIIDSRYYHHYFRTSGFNGECFKRGRGIMAMRWRTYAEQFKDIKVIKPSLTEQREIIDYLDKKCATIDTLIAKKEQLITELEAYKKSLIYEYVTGKKEVLLNE